jgi:gas vesicle protein
MFQKLCGEKAARSVILVSTMWSLVKPDVGKEREKRVQDLFWKDMLERGSIHARFLNNVESAWSIIDRLVESSSPSHGDVRLAEELSQLHRHLSETDAGKTLYDSLQRELYNYKEAVRKLQEQAQKEGNKEEAKNLENDFREAQEKLNSTFEQLQELKISLGRRILMWFGFRRVSCINFD